MARLSVWVGAVLAGVSGAAAGQPPVIPPADAPAAVVPVVAKVEVGTPPLNGREMLPRALAAAREAYAKTRDYAGHLVRQERVGGVLLPEQAAEIRGRVTPAAVNVRVVKPAAVAGEEVSYLPAKATRTVRFKPAGVDGVRGFQTLALDDPKAVAHTRHPASEVGLAAVLDRVESVLKTEARLNHPVAVVAADYTFAGRPAARYEVYADAAHPARYAARCVVLFDKQTKLPVRFEAYTAPKPGHPQGELIEVQSYVGLRLNTGLGDAAFER